MLNIEELPKHGALVGRTGTVTGAIVGQWNIPIVARVVVRDGRRAVVGECYPASPRAGAAAGRFELRGLPPGSYLLEVQAPGFCRALRYNVTVAAGTTTVVGAIRLTHANSPSVTRAPRRSGGSPPAETPLLSRTG